MRFVFCGLLLASSYAMGAIRCDDLKRELQDMEKAQSEVLATMIENHEMFASSMEQYARIAGNANTQGKRNGLPVIFQQMQSTATVFRKRGAEGRQLQKDMELASHQLLKRVQLCLRD